MRQNVRWHMLAAVWLLAGTLFVFFFASYINRSVGKRANTQDAHNARVEFERKPKQIQHRKKVRKKVKKRKKTKPRTVAPPPMLNSAITGVEVNIPELDIDTDFGSNIEGSLKDSFNDNMIMTSDAVDSPPVPSITVSPEYPRKARAAGITGYVTFNLLIDEHGNVKRAQMLDSDPRGIFEEAAREAVLQWKFKPGTYKGRAVKVWARQKISFRLEAS